MKCPICEVNDISDTKVQSCIDCIRTGRDMEFFLTNEIRSNVLTRIRELPEVASANLWPTIPGSYQLGVMLTDGRCVLASAAIVEGITLMIAPAIPPMDGQWAIVVGESDEGDWPMEKFDPRPELYTDEELIEAIASV